MKPLPATYVEGFHDRKAVEAMEYRTLGKTGLKISKLALGCATLSSLFGLLDEKEAIELVRQAIKQGINYIDTAPWYGQGRSESILGKALKGIPRQAYYIATKVGRYEPDYEHMFDYTIEKTQKSVQKSLELLEHDYVDVIQIHEIEFAPSLEVILNQTLPELARQVTEGKAKHIGITGYPVSLLKECVERSNINVAVVLSYSRNTLIDNTLLQYIPFFKKHNIGILSAAAPCMGLLTNNGPQDWHLASIETKKYCAEAARYCKDHGVELGKLAVWYSMQCEDVSGNLVGMKTLNDLKMNLDVVRNGISNPEKEILKEIQEKYISKVKEKHWEGRELKQYWNYMKNKSK